MEWLCNDIKCLPEIARKILEHCPSKKIAFYGSIGAGKTTVIKEICKQLGVQETVSSPTFTILNEYSGPPKVNHFDFYRIKKPDEIYELGYEEYFFSGDYVLIEWPEKIDYLLPDNFSVIKIDILEANKRIFSCVNR